METTVRRVPQQARSKERVARVLAAADRIVAVEGVEALRMVRLAQDAGVSVGSLYQYLPDRDAVLDALADEYLGRIEGTLDDLIAAAGQQHWDDPVEGLVEVFAEVYRREPGFRALWFGRHVSEAIRVADREHKRRMADGLRRIVLAQKMLPDREWVGRACLAVHLMADALMQEAFRIDPNGDTKMLRELKTALRGYLAELERRTD